VDEEAGDPLGAAGGRGERFGIRNRIRKENVMQFRNVVLFIAVMGLAVGIPAAAQVAQSEAVPVSGGYHEPAVAQEVAYDGVLHLVWTPLDGGSGWSLTAILVADARLASSGTKLVVNGFSEDQVLTSRGSQGDVAIPILASSPDGKAGFRGELVVGVQLPAGAATPVAVSDAIGSDTNVVRYLAVPVSGSCRDPALGREVTYDGVAHLYWVPPAGSVGEWTLSGVVLVGAVCGATGTSFLYCANCQDHVALAAGSSRAIDLPVFATGTCSLAGFRGSVALAVSLPEGAAMPRVDSVALSFR